MQSAGRVRRRCAPDGNASERTVHWAELRSGHPEALSPRAEERAALAAAGVIGGSGVLLLRPAVDELMDRAPEPAVLGAVRAAAEAVPEVRAVETLTARKIGTAYRVVAHMQADPALSLAAAHALGHAPQAAVQRAGRRVQSVVVHMEPYETPASADTRAADGLARRS